MLKWWQKQQKPTCSDEITDHIGTIFGRGAHRSAAAFAAGRDKKADAQFLSAPEPVAYSCNSLDFFDCAEVEVSSLLQRRPEIHALDSDIERLRKRHAKSGLAHDGLVALIAQAPRAVLAQLQMDKFPHGYRNKQRRPLRTDRF